ncbi:MAG: mevalonate kinase [Candidatus Bathyarchaeia archaeon]
MGAVASAPAKIILFGEHFVVYGEPAIVLAIDTRARASAELRTDQRIYVNSVDLGLSGFFMHERFHPERGGEEARTKLEPARIAIQRVLDFSKKEVGMNVKIESSISVAAGLGSSAAVAAAVAVASSRLLNLELSKEEIFHIAYEAERFVHGTPSGIDPATSTYGGVHLFDKKRGVTSLNVEGDIPLVVGDTGMKRSTGSLVAMVRERKERFPSIIDSIIKTGGKIALRAVKALETGALNAVGELMNINHALLCAVGVSNEPLERLVYAARKAGALGAKLTGAGGGGCMIALCLPDKLEEVAEAIERAGGTVFIARKTDEGAKIES